MADKTKKNNCFNKDFLQCAVRELSRLLVGRTNGQEQIWKKNPPPNWPAHLTWKNPTSSPKDKLPELEEKFNFLKQNLSNHSIPEDQKIILRLYEEKKLKDLSFCLDAFKVIEALNNLNPPADSCQDTNEIVNRLLSKMDDFKTKLIKHSENNRTSNKFVPILPKCTQESVLLKVNHIDDSIISYHNGETSLLISNATSYFNHMEKNNSPNNNIFVLRPHLPCLDQNSYNSGTGTKRKDETTVSESAHENSKPKRRRVELNNNDLKIDNTQTSASDFNILISHNTVSGDYQGLQVNTRTDLDNSSFSPPTSQDCNRPAVFITRLKSQSTTPDICCPQILNTPLTVTSPCTSVSSDGHSPAILQDVSNVSTPLTQRSNDSGHESEDSLDQDPSLEDLDIILNLCDNIIAASDKEFENLIEPETFLDS